MLPKSNGDDIYVGELEEAAVDTVEEKFVVFDANTCGQTHGIVWADAEDSEAGGDCLEQYEVVEDEEVYEVVVDEEAIQIGGLTLQRLFYFLFIYFNFVCVFLLFIYKYTNINIRTYSYNIEYRHMYIYIIYIYMHTSA